MQSIVSGLGGHDSWGWPALRRRVLGALDPHFDIGARWGPLLQAIGDSRALELELS